MGAFDDFLHGVVNDCVNGPPSEAEWLDKYLGDLQGELREERGQRHPDAVLIAGLLEDIAETRQRIAGLKS